MRSSRRRKRRQRLLLTLLRRASSWLFELFAPAKNTTFSMPADGHIQIVHTFEVGKYVRVYYRQAVSGAQSTNCNNIYLYGSTTAYIRHYETDGAGSASLVGSTHSLGFADGTKYTVDFYCSGASVDIYINGVFLRTDTTTINITNDQGGEVSFSIVTNDIELRGA